MKERSYTREPNESLAAMRAALAGFSDVTFQISRRSDLYLARGGTLFCVLSSRGCSLRLSRNRVDQLLQVKAGRRQRPAPDRHMREWIALPSDPGSWLGLLQEAYAYVGNLIGEAGFLLSAFLSEARWIH